MDLNSFGKSPHLFEFINKWMPHLIFDGSINIDQSCISNWSSNLYYSLLNHNLPSATDAVTLGIIDVTYKSGSSFILDSIKAKNNCVIIRVTTGIEEVSPFSFMYFLRSRQEFKFSKSDAILDDFFILPVYSSMAYQQTSHGFTVHELLIDGSLLSTQHRLLAINDHFKSVVDREFELPDFDIGGFAYFSINKVSPARIASIELDSEIAIAILSYGLKFDTFSPEVGKEFLFDWFKIAPRNTKVLYKILIPSGKNLVLPVFGRVISESYGLMRCS